MNTTAKTRNAAKRTIGVLHYTIGGRFVGKDVVIVGRNWPVCGARVVGGALEIERVTCRRCLAFMRTHVRTGDA